MSQVQRPHKISLYLNDEEKADFDTIKQYYGITSNAAAVRRTIAEHAKTVKAEATRAGRAKRVTYSRRVH
jgi:hypothetical protein